MPCNGLTTTKQILLTRRVQAQRWVGNYWSPTIFQNITNKKETKLANQEPRMGRYKLVTKDIPKQNKQTNT